METITARVPDELEAELERYLEVENVERSAAIRTLLRQGLAEWRTDRATRALEAGEVTFARAAAIAELSAWEFASVVAETDDTWIGDDHLETDLDDL